MNELVERLRDPMLLTDGVVNLRGLDLINEAADEIERLTALIASPAVEEEGCANCGSSRDSHIDRIDASPGQCDTYVALSPVPNAELAAHQMTPVSERARDLAKAIMAKSVYPIWPADAERNISEGIADLLAGQPAVSIEEQREAIARTICEGAGDDFDQLGQYWVETHYAETADAILALRQPAPPVDGWATVRAMGLELTEDGYSLRTPYDGDADDDGRSIVVGGDVVATFVDSDDGEELREAVLSMLVAPPIGSDRAGDA